MAKKKKSQTKKELKAFAKYYDELSVDGKVNYAWHILETLMREYDIEVVQASAMDENGQCYDFHGLAAIYKGDGALYD